jgi:hypothetical protein
LPPVLATVNESLHGSGRYSSRPWKGRYCVKRILVLLSVVALMVVMLAMSVAPAFARPPLYDCEHPETGAFAPDIPSNAKHFFLKEGFECVKQ